MNKRDNVYARYEDQNVKTVLVYANESNELFYDVEFKNPVLNDELSDLFLKGMAVVSDAVTYKPIACATSDGGEKVGVICYNGTSAIPFTATEPVEEEN